MAASTWIDKEVLSAVEKYKKDDPRDYEDNPGREWDDEDQANYDRKLWQGGEDY
jgi:hypothetical protein